jgi:membrane protein YqaA with SNARE-associated domain
MKQFAGRLFVLFLQFGGLGQFALGVLDSSFLVMPLGNDLLMVALAARHHSFLRMTYYAAMATAGSVVGCLIMDIVCRKGGEELLERHVSAGRLQFVLRKIRQNAGWTLGVVSLMPPPFPFTPFVMAAAALEYPRKKLLTVIGVTRFLRFFLIGVLALLFGSRILRWAESAIFQYVMVGLICIAILASVLSVVRWVRKSQAAGSMRRTSSSSERKPSAGKSPAAIKTGR